MKKARFDPSGAASRDIPEDLLAELHAVASMPDDQIDTSDPDAPEVTDWSGATRGRFYRPMKKLKSLRVDEDVLAYFQAQGPGYQTRINRVLRAAMLRGLRRQVQAKPKEQSA
jgi:uncharacterized protein (DUF4415 family)